jgi:hypothetical protein
VLLAGAVWLATRPQEPLQTEASAAETKATPPSGPAVLPSPAATTTAGASVAAPLATASAAPAPAEPSSAPTPEVASAAPVASGEPSPSGPSTAGSAATAGETVMVHINITPEGSKIVLKGEEVGKTPMTMEVPRGEKRVFEVVSKGYYPRRLVIDGTKEEIAYGLKPIEP